jgi:integrase
MAMVELKGLCKVTAKGKTYWYAWRGGPRIHAPHGTPAFAEEYVAHHAARKGGDKARVSGLIVDFKLSDAWVKEAADGGLAASTKRDWGRCLDDVQIHFGSLRIASFADARAVPNIYRWLSAWADRPRERDRHKQVLSALLAFAIKSGRLAANPCAEIESAYASDRADIIWTPEDIEAFANAKDKRGGAQSEEIIWAMRLATLTGLRQGDLLKLTWSQVGDLAIERRTNKSRVRGSAPATALVPMYGELRDFLATIPKRGPMVLTNTQGRPWADGFRGSWNDALTRAGLKGRLRFHDTRGTFATRLYLAGFTIREIAEAMAWSEDRVDKIIKRYVTRDAMLRDRIRKLDEARTGSAKHRAKPAKSSR